MAEYTPNLNLLKKDPIADANDTFNIEIMLNENWDKIDADKKAQDEAIAAAKTDAKAYTDAHEEKAAPHSGHETPAGAQAKADAAETNAKNHANSLVGTLSNLLTTAKNNVVAAINEIFGKVEDVEGDLESHKADYAKEATEFTIESDNIYERVNCNYYKKNGFVFLNLSRIQKKDSSAFELGEFIAMLPVGFRPKQTVYVQGMSQTGSVRKSISLIVLATGEVQMGQSSTDNYIRLSVTYYAGGGTV